MFRFSLREVLAVFALASLAFASLTFANEFWVASVIGVTMFLLFVLSIIAVVDRGSRQAFAIGFVLTMIAYGLILITGQQTTGSGGSVYSQNIEFDQGRGRLPTTQLLRYVHNAVEHNEWVDASGKVIPDYDPNKPGAPKPIGGGFSGSFGPGAFFREIPPREVFMPIGHCWWALLLGYVGGHFARYVYWQRTGESHNRAADIS